MKKKIVIFLKILRYLVAYYKFKKKGSNLDFSMGGKFLHPEEISFGSNVFIGRSFHISARNLCIGSNVMFGPNLVIECDNHRFDKIGTPMFNYSNERNIKGITIEDDVWVGANVIILPGVTVKEGAIIGAGSVVTKDIPPYSICVGNPCRPKKNRFDKIELKQHLDIVKSKYSLESCEFQSLTHIN